ncbi:asparaginase [Ottowia testudinis]|nr:asparaginase [Ottowia testudinis]
MTTTSSLNRPRIVVVATGGTIAGAGAGGGAPSAAYQSAIFTADALLASVPGLERQAELQAEQLLQIDSADFTDDRLLLLARRVADLCARDEVDGVVITHGTDTMEESAYFLHLTVKSAKPIVLTGAMRPGTAPAADGPANLLHAVAVAAHPSSVGRGVLVVMNEEVHSARDVTKVHAMRLDAFASPHGPLGTVVEGAPRWYRAVARPHTLHSEFDLARIDTLPLVGVVTSHGNMRREIFDAWVAAGARAIVHAGFGGGTVPGYLKPLFAELCAAGVPIVRCSRVGAGQVIRNASFDDDASGSVAADDQNPPRARLLAALALTRAQDVGEMQRIFSCY